MSLTQEIIRKKRDRQPLSRDEIGEFVRGVVDGSVANEQVAAFAMAVYFNDMSVDERVALTLAQRDSGQVLSWDSTRLKVTNHPEANSYLQRTYRDGWHVARF